MKQILLIAYTLISIVFGLWLGTAYNEFEYLIPIVLVSMFSFYFLCRMDDKINFKGVGIYLLSLMIAFTICFAIFSPSNIETIRLTSMKTLSVMFVILGTLSGGILRYKFYQWESRKETEGDVNERAKK